MAPGASPAIMQRTRRIPAPPRDGGGLSVIPREFMNVRAGILAALILTYIWRFHELSGVLSPFRMATLATLGSWVMLVLKPRMGQLRRAFGLPQVVFLFIWIGWIGITSPFALSPSVATDVWVDGHLKSLTMFLFTVGCLISLRWIHLAMALHVAGASVIAFYYVKGGFPLWGSPLEMYDVNDMAMHFNMVIPLALFFALTTRRLWARLLLLGVVGTLTVCVLMTQSRGGFLTVGTLIATMLVFSRGIKLWMRLALPLLLALGFYALPPDTQERLSTLFNPAEDYNMTAEGGRIEVWRRGLGYLRDHPVTGVGADNFVIAEYTLSERARLDVGSVEAKVTHNSFLQVAVETGVPGFLFYAGAILLTLARLITLHIRLGKLRGDPRALRLMLNTDMLILSLVAFIVNGFFLSMGYAVILFSVLAIAASFDVLVRRWLLAVSDSHAARSRGATARSRRRRLVEQATGPRA